MKQLYIGNCIRNLPLLKMCVQKYEKMEVYN